MGGGGILKLSSEYPYSEEFWTKISTTPAGLCITDSLSHTTYVETKKNWQNKNIRNRVCSSSSFRKTISQPQAVFAMLGDHSVQD